MTLASTERKPRCTAQVKHPIDPNGTKRCGNHTADVTGKCWRHR